LLGFGILVCNAANRFDIDFEVRRWKGSEKREADDEREAGALAEMGEKWPRRRMQGLS